MSKIRSLLNLLRKNNIPECINTLKTRDECLMTGIRNVIQHAKHGIPDMGIPKSEPLFVKESNFFEHNVNGTLFDTEVHGLTNLQLISVKSDLKKFIWYCTVYFPNIKFFSNFVFTTTVLILPLTMRGKFQCSMIEVKSDIIMNGKLVEESNEQYLKIDKFKMEIKYFDYIGEFDTGTKNIFIHQINYLFNRDDQKKIFKRDFKQQLENITEDFAMKTLSPFVERVKFSEFYPDFKKQ